MGAMAKSKSSKRANEGHDKKHERKGKRRKHEGRQEETQENEEEVESDEDEDFEELTLEEKCDLIAELSESILQDPSTAFSSSSAHNEGPKLPSKIKKLLELANPSKPGSDPYTARLSCMSLVAIFQDIIPSYRIRLPTAAEMNVRVQKETKKLWDYERALLHHYQLFLQLLEKTWDRNGSADPLGVTAILSLCQLLQSKPHFNFRSNILRVVVRHMNHKSDAGEACCAAMQHLFANDAQGDVALEAARLVCKLIKDCKFKVGPQVLASFQSLPLRVHIDEAQAAKIATQANAKKRKKDKESADIESELQEGSGRVNKILLARSQSDTLQAVTVTYFRILKSDSSMTEELLPTALSGLAKVAHLINMDTVLDLLDVLKDMLQRVDDLPLEASLNCVLCAFQTLEGPGRELKIDQKEYITPLYTQLPRLCSASPDSVKIALKCLEFAFLKRREYSVVRMAAFLKQLATVSMHSPPSTAAPILCFCRHLLHRYQSLHPLLDHELDVITSGPYDPTVNDPEHANPFATCCWELSTLACSITPHVSNHALKAAGLKMLQLPAEKVERVRAAVAPNDELYIDAKRLKKKHPLAPRPCNKQVRFISPNDTGYLKS